MSKLIARKKWGGGMVRTMIGLTGIAVTGSILTIGATGAYADNTDTVDTVNLTIPVSCTYGSGGGTYNDTMAGGTVKEITANAITTSCNDTSGYAIYAIGFSNNKYTSDTTGNNNDMITSLGSSHNITTSSNNTYGSNWKMKLTSPVDAVVESAFNNTYTTIPATYTKVASYNTNTTGGSITPKYQITTGSSQPAGTYTGKVKYTLVHPSTAQAPVACNPDATTIGDAVCLQDFAGPNYDAIVASMTAETQYTKKDKRDGKTYTIAKYQTGTDSSTSQPIYDVWMTQNLDLDLDSSKTYTNEDTDIGYNTSTGTYGTASWSPTRSTYTTTANQIHEWCNGGTWNSGGWCEGNDTPESYDPGNLYWNSTESDFTDWGDYYASCDFSTSTPTCNQSLNPLSTYTGSTGTAQYHLGNYYNWAAALATNDSSIYDDDDLVEQSICPAGWTLPRTGTGEDTFYALWNQYGFASSSYNDSNSNGQHDSNEAALWTSPLYFSAGGFFYGVLTDVGYDGYFWSPVADGSSYARYAYFVVDGGSYPSVLSVRDYGYSVRCIARPVAGS